MKYISVNYKLVICKRIMFLVVFLLGILSIQAQNVLFKNGIQQGVVKVRFDESMTTTLSQMQIKTKGKTLSTGITSLDKAASSIKAFKMERLIPEAPNQALEAKHRKAGLHLWYVVEFDQNIDPKVAIQALSTVSGIKDVECEYLKKIAPTKASPYTPGPATYASQPFNDPYLKDQWHYINTGQLGLTGDKADANLAPAWQVTSGRSDIIVAVQDEGVDVNHEDLKANMWINTKEIPGNGIDDDGNGYIDDVYGFNFVKLSGNIDAETHGTHVAGTVAAVNNNGIGVAGVAGGSGKGDGVKIMSLQIIGGATAGHIFKSYVYAADMGAVISQNSWGYQSPGVYEKDVLAGIDYFIGEAGNYSGSPMKGGIVIFASGNDTTDADFWPGVYEKCLSVSAVGPEWKMAEYSNFGKWVEVSAPGGDMTTYGMSKAGVLSTFPGNQYGYLHGTSMACPHVSGVAALALASSDKQMTNTELWQRLLTSVKNIDKYNPDYIGKLGTGSIDAELAIRANGKVAPNQITTLAVKGVSQEFATLEWLVPADSDDGTPLYFNIYYSTEPITDATLSKAKKLELKNESAVGETISFEIKELLGTTKYYFGVISLDRWGNTSVLSNIATGTTNSGPTIGVSTGSIDNILSLSANTSQSAIANKDFQLLNSSEGVLRWEYYIRNSGYTHSVSGFSAKAFPSVLSNPKGIGMENAASPVKTVRNADITSYAAFTTIEKKYINYTSFYIGDADPSVPTSGAVKFIVTEQDGFNLTQVKAVAKYTMGTGPLVIEVYKGGLSKDKLCMVEEYQPQNSWTTSHNIAFKEHTYFEKGSEFYIVVHVPAGNGYSLGIGDELSPEYSDYCYYSSNYGATWDLLSNVGVAQTLVWNIIAVSQLPNISEFITLDPSSGNVSGNSDTKISLKANGTNLINGTYKANVVFKSNDSKNGEYRMPVVFDISGHKPNLVYPKIVEFGSVFMNAESTLDIVLENTGYGLVKDLQATIDNSQFTIISQPSVVEAKGESILRVKFEPTSLGNTNGKLTVTNGQYTYTISLFGVGAETSEIQITPTSQTVDNVAIGDEVDCNFTIKNTGGFPLKYFIPGYDNQNISTDWPTNYHSYGYVVRSNNAEITADASLPYQFTDISATGIDISRDFIDSNYSTVSFGFDFPYYGVIQDKIYITKSGFTTFDNTAQPYNVPKLKGDLKGYISLMGYNASTTISNGKIHYKAESDHLIIQYTNIEYAGEKFTGQIVLFADGNIRFYYENIPTIDYAANTTILVEDIAQKDGILVRNVESKFFLKNGTVIGFDYPGPDIIASVENGSGVVAPGESVSVNVKLNTDSLSEGVITRNINVINNDPQNSTVAFSAQLNITSGGVVDYVASTDKVDFDVIYEGYPYSKEFSIRNKGTKTVTINSLSNDVSKFTITGSMTIAPGLNEIYKVEPNTANITDLEDELQITFSDGRSLKVGLKALVRSVPVAVADLTSVTATLNLGENKSYPFEVENTGGSDLEVSFIGGQWFRFEDTSNIPISKYAYHVKEENDGEPSYNWVDIIKTGEKVPYDYNGMTDKKRFWSEIELPFTFSYYGVEYDKIKAGYTGIIALGGDPDAQPYPATILPLEVSDVAFIYPLWSLGGFDTYNHPDDAGLYYQVYDDKVIISWMCYVNYFGWGQSCQAILYKDGTIKLQYKWTDGTSDGTGSGIVGFQNAGGTEYTSISNKSRLPFGKGLAYVIVPDNKHVIAPNSKIEGNLIFDASNIYGGDFNDTLIIKTNVPSTPELEKPLLIKVPGVTKIDAPEAIEVGDTEVVFYSESMSYKMVEKPLIITNTGTAPFRITGGKMETGGRYLTQLLYVPSSGGAAWIPIEDLLTSYPEQLLLPGASFKSLVKFSPEVAGTYEDVLILSSTISEIRVKLSGFGYDPPVINIDNTPINVSFNTADQSESRSIAFDNKDGGYKLDYNISVKYKRGLTENTSNEKIASAKNIGDTAIITSSMTAIGKKALSIAPYADDFNRKIQYVDEQGINNAMGNNGSTGTLVATKFVADKTGLNLSDVGTYVNLDKGISGTIKVEVRVGGNNIANALPVATSSVEFEYPAGVIERQTIVKQSITLDAPVQILPNEEFYVIFTYPMDLTYPQTMQLGGVDLAPKRYWWFSGGEWTDLQTYIGSINPNTGYVMYAAERDYVESGWLKIMTSDSGTLQKGETTKTDIKLVASFAERGDQKADLVIKSSDVNASVVEIPIALHMNEAPAFVNIPSSIITAEKEITEHTIIVTDNEENKFEVIVLEKPEFVTSTKNQNNNIVLSIAPDYGHAGNYKISMKATDEYDAVNEYIIDVYVAKTNRAPQYSGNVNELKYTIGSTPERMDINDLFTDPDEDKFNFTVTSQDNKIAEVYQSGSEFFMVEPKAVGATKLSFVVTDIHNASTDYEMNVVVGSCLDPEGVIVQKWNNALIANNLNGDYVAYQWYKNGTMISGATKQYYAERDGELDFEAEYFVQLTTTEGKTVFTCPMTPVKKDTSLKAYPNPVKSGQPVKIEAHLPDLDTNPLTIEVINLSGRIVKTISSNNIESLVDMPSESGSYIIRVTNSTIKRTFNIIVQ